MAGSPAPHSALDDPSAQWQPFGFTVRRDGSTADGANLEADLAEALRARGVVGAVADGGVAALPGWLLVRIAIDDDGRVVTAAGGLPPRPSIQVEELVGALARQLGVTAVIDEENALGPDGRPVAGEDVDLLADVEGDLRFVFAWRGTDLLGARALASSTKQPVTAYRHEAWVIAVVEDSADVALGPPSAWDLGFPFVAMSRTGEVRSVTYAAGKGRKALKLDLTWVPPMHPVLPDPDGDGTAVRRLAVWLSTARLDPDDLPTHPDLGDELVGDLVAASGSPDGHRFLLTVGTLLDVPALVAELAEGLPGAALQAGAPERIEPSSASALVGAAFRTEFSREPTGSDPFSRLRRLFRRRPGWHLTFGLVELALATLCWLSLLATWSAMPGWLRTTAAILLTVDGLGNAALALHRLRQLRSGTAA